MKKILNTLGELVYLNLLFLLTTLPVVTIGTAITTSYEMIDLINKNFEINILTRYFEKFKKNLSKTIGINILTMILLGVFILISKFLYIQGGILGNVMLYLFMSSGLLIYITFLYYYYLVIEYKERKNMDIIKYSMYLGIRNIPTSLIIITMHLIVLGIVFFFSEYIFFIWEFFIIIGFSILLYSNYKLLQKIKY